jgi:iron complex transport system permease protein
LDFSGDRSSLKATYAALGVLTVAACAAGLFVGHGSLGDAALRETFLRLRGYRMAAAFLAGASLAVSGVAVQALFRNPLADASIVGTTAGASLGGELAMFGYSMLTIRLGRIVPEMVVPIGCLGGALVSLALLLAVVRRGRGPLVVLLTGFILSMLFVAANGLLTAVAQDSWEIARALISFALGGVSGVGPRQLLMALPLFTFGVAALWFWGPPLDLLLTGTNEARSLGLDVRETRRWAVVWVAMLTTAAVSLGGNLAFVGLIVPHGLRPFTGVLTRRLLPASALAGGGFVVLCDLLSRGLPTRNEIPLGVITGLVGAPVFIVLLLRMYRGVDDA